MYKWVPAPIFFGGGGRGLGVVGRGGVQLSTHTIPSFLSTSEFEMPDLVLALLVYLCNLIFHELERQWF